MFVLPSSAAFLARYSVPEQETFQKFFEFWLVEQHQYLDKLISAAKEHDDANERHLLGPLVDQVMEHYEQYYCAKSKCSKVDILAMFSPSWFSSLENAFLWIGGWRPSMAFHLLYSKSGLQLEAQLDDLFRGLACKDLGNLSAAQLCRVDEFQRKTIIEEREMTEKMAKHQETVADTSMVELSHVMSESLRRTSEASRIQEAVAPAPAAEEEEEDERVKSTLNSKEDKLKELLARADDLRLRTLRGVIDILTPIQAVHFLIAAAELHLRVHEWGKNRDANAQHDTLDSSVH